MNRRARLLLAITIVAAGAAVVVLAGGSRESPAPTVEASPPPERADPLEVYDPVAAGETLPDGYRPFLDRDQIVPVYEPEFTTAAGVDWPADSLVVGIEGAETAKAYPITHLNQREMVLDFLDGIPILVSW